MRMIPGPGFPLRSPQLDTVPWGSVSRILTRSPSCMAEIASPIASVDLPEPPFWVAKMMVRMDAPPFPNRGAGERKNRKEVEPIGAIEREIHRLIRSEPRFRAPIIRNAAPGQRFTANPAAYRLPGECLGRRAATASRRVPVRGLPL